MPSERVLVSTSPRESAEMPKLSFAPALGFIIAVVLLGNPPGVKAQQKSQTLTMIFFDMSSTHSVMLALSEKL